MFADIAGYTAMMQQNEQYAMSLLGRFKEVLEEISPKYEGRIIQYFGDGCLLAFDSSTNSVACAIALQKKFNKTPAVPIRIGLHLGDVIFKNENAYGDGVNIASRIESLGIPGAILMSKTIRDQIKNKSEFLLASLGSFDFKNVAEPMEVFALANPGFVVPKQEEMHGKLKDLPKKLSRLKFLVTIAVIVITAFTSWYVFTQKASNDKLEIPASPTAQSIAVLPFTDMSPKKDQAYLGDGLAEDIITALSGNKNLKVIGRTSSFQFKGKQVDLREVGEKLGVHTILEGSIQKSGNTVKITAQLINVKDGTHIWSEKWLRGLNDIFIIQDEISDQISQKLMIPFDKKPERKFRQVNPDAYDDYLKGRQLFFTGPSEDVMKAKDYFLSAVKKDTTFAEAYAWLTAVYGTLSQYIYPSIESKKREIAIDSAILMAKKAISIDDNNSTAHVAIGLVYYFKYDWVAMEKELRKAVEINPGPIEKGELARTLAGFGFFEEALSLIQEALLLDPLNTGTILSYGEILYSSGKTDEAISQVNKVLKIDSLYSLYFGAYGLLANCYVNKKEYKKALLAWSKQHEAYGNHELAEIYRHSDFKTAMKAWLKQATTPNAPYAANDFTIAYIYSILEEKDSTFKYLDLAYKKHQGAFLKLNTNSNFYFLRSDPRYAELYHKLNFDKYDDYKGVIKPNYKK